MSIEGKVIMLTGAAGTGKSTLAEECANQIRPLRKVDFGHLLLERKRGHGYPNLTYDELRSKSSEIVTPEDVRATDAALIDSLPDLRTSTHVLIDSHAVNREAFGYRITHYSFDALRRIAFNAIIVTYCDPDVWMERRARNPQGRPELSRFEVQHYMALQETVGVDYAIMCGCPCYLLDTTTHGPPELADNVRRIIGFVGGAVYT
jgi:adenylate kinase